jgi:hypothetical protein
MKTLAVVRTVMFALLCVYALYASRSLVYVFFPKAGLSLAIAEVVSIVEQLAVAAWLAVAWIGIDAYLSFAVLRRASAPGARAPGAAK